MWRGDSKPRSTLPVWIPLLIVAPFVGSFLGVVVWREGDFSRVADGRSRCDSCGAALQARDLVPLASYLALRGRCRACGARLSLFYPVIELSAIVPVVWAATLQSDGTLLLSVVLGWFLIALAAIDWRTLRLPDSLTLPLLAIGLLSAWFYDRGHWLDHALGAVLAFAVFAGLTFAYRRLRGREGLGLGDAKLAGALGAFVAWQGMSGAVFLGAMAALATVLVRALLRRPLARAEPIAFGPFLALGAWIVWLYGPLMPGWS
jgi:leader peptidase (prepilin peptidase)/N-methyltransferase